MGDKNAKEVRKQLRAIVEEILPSVLESAVLKEVLKKLHEENMSRMDKIDGHVAQVLGVVNERSKDMMGYLVRQTSKPEKLE